MLNTIFTTNVYSRAFNKQQLEIPMTSKLVTMATSAEVKNAYFEPIEADYFLNYSVKRYLFKTFLFSKQSKANP